MNATLGVNNIVDQPGQAPAAQGEGSANHPYPTHIRAAVCGVGGDATPLPAELVELSLSGGGVEVSGEFEARLFWLRFDWREWECCFECKCISKRPVGQRAFVQARFAGLSSEETAFLQDIVDSLSQQFEASQRRLVQTHARRMHDLRASIDDGSYRPDSIAVTRSILNQATRSGGRVRR